MQKWEYLTVIFQSDWKVQTINGEKKWKAIFAGGFAGEKLWDFLPEAGSNGWELVAVRNTRKGNPNLFLKRPIED